MPSISIPVDRSFPLKKISLRNFKSVKDAEVTISPLTVVVGANSSGKSTLLQAILSISQAISKDLNGTTYPLNGEKISLGTFAETKSFFAEDLDSPIQIGFELEGDYFSNRNPLTTQVRQRTEVIRRSNNYRVKFKFDLTKSGSNESGTAQVSHILINSERKNQSGPGEISHSMKIDLSFNSDIPLIDQRRRDSNNDCSGTVYDSATDRTYPVNRASFSGLIPTTLWERGDNSIFVAEQIIEAVNECLAVELDSEISRIKSKPVSESDLKVIEKSAIKIACSIFEDLVHNSFLDLGEDEDEIQSYLHDEDDWTFRHEVQKLDPEQKRNLAALVANSDIGRIVSALERELDFPFALGGIAFRAIRGEVSHSSDDLAAMTRQVFRNKITHLGPIRLTPKVNYDPSSGRPDVGSAGEYTAYVLHTRGNQKLMFPLPNGNREYVSLNEALNLWLESFGLASGAKTEDNGRLGIGLRLNLISGGNEVDLTSVGTGVSQVLPVLVSCLIARKSTVLLLEEPELHLHPKLQMDLADFLIACCKSGRQIIIETHSEHIINRIRRRIAEGDDRELNDLIGILFVEQSNGITQYRSPSINKFGGLGSDWPDGFLDVGAGEMENLLGAGLAKRKKS